MKRTASIILSIILTFNMVAVYSFGGSISYAADNGQSQTTVEETTGGGDNTEQSSGETSIFPQLSEEKGESIGEPSAVGQNEEEPEPISMVEVKASVQWIDNGNNEKTRPDAEAYLPLLCVLVFNEEGQQIDEIALPENTEYTESGTSGAHISCLLPEFDKEGKPLSYKIKQDNTKLRTDLKYLSQDEPGESFLNTQAIDYEVNIQSIDGANTIDGVTHVDFMGKLLEQGGILSLKADGEEFDIGQLPDKGGWSFNAESGIGTYVIKNIPRFDENGKEIEYTLTMVANEEKGQGEDKEYFLNDSTGRYEIVNDNTEVPNHGSDIDFAANGGTIKLTLTDKTEYKATKYWLDEDPVDRPNAHFELWRYTDMKDGSKGYKTASPVRDSSNTQITLTLNGPMEGVQSDIIISADNLNSLVKIDEPLEKYDAKGFEYKYFLREKMEGGNASYEQILDPEVTIKDGKAVNIVEHERADKQDKSIYNEGTVANRIHEDTNVQTPKKWVAHAYIDKIKHIEVEMKLMQRSANRDDGDSDEWTEALDKDGKAITMSKDGFSEVFPEKIFARSMPKYDALGNEMEYKWIENAVIEDEENILNDEKNGFRTELNKENSWDPDRTDTISGHKIKRQNYEDYTSTVENGVITNRLEGVLDYVVEKKWTDENGNVVPAPAGAKATFAIVNNQGIPPVYVTLDGTPDNDYEEFEWLGHVKDLPKYTEDGALIEYSVHEAAMEGYIGTVLHSGEDRVTTIVNAPGDGIILPIEKEWVDDDDSGCRYDSIVAVYYKDPETNEEINLSEKYNRYATITQTDGWYEEYAVPGDFLGERTAGDPKWDISNYFIREEALKSRGADGYKVEDSNQYGDMKGEETVTTDNHMYVTEYYRKSADEGGILVVRNRRVGTVDITVTKTWTDKGADKTKRPEAHLELAVKSGSAEVVSDGLDKDGYVLADGVKKVTLPTDVSVDRTVDAGRKTTYTFNGLPKYDKKGKVIVYDVNEIWKEDSDASAKDYTRSSSSDYVDRDKEPSPASLLSRSEEEFDKMTVDINNYRTGIVDVKFYKEWNDNYAYIHGKRPDIFVELYDTKDLDDNGNALGKDNDSVNPEPLGFKTNDWEIDDREDRSDSSRFWKVTFKNQPRYTEDGELITYYAMESTNGSVKQFDYQDTQFKRADLTDVTIDDLDTWVQVATDDYTVLKENGTFVNQVRNQVKLIGKKIWKNIPKGFDGELPVININLQRYLTNDESREMEQVKDDDGKDVQIKNMTTPEGERTLTFTINEDDQQHAEPHYNYSPEKYNHEGVLYGFTFEEEVLDVTNRSDDGVKLKDLYRNSTDGNMILTNIYPGDNYKGSISIKKNWENRPEDLTESFNQYPEIIFKLYSYYKNKAGRETVEIVKTQRVSASEFRKDDPKIDFDGETFPIYAPDGFKYVYYIEEEYVNGYTHSEFLTDLSGDITKVSEPSSIAERGGFTFNKPADSQMAKAVEAKGNIENTYKPEKTRISGTKEWTDNGNAFGTRPDLSEAQDVLNLTLYKYADSQTDQDNAIGSQNDAIVVTDAAGNPVQPSDWKVDFPHANRWIFTYEDLDLWAPNGTKWKYFVKEEISDEYKDLYSQNKTWSSASGTGTEEVASMGVQANHLSKRVELIKRWTDKDYLIRPDVVFEMQVKIGDGGWQHARNVEPFKTANVISSSEGPWTYILSDKGSASQKEYEKHWDNFPVKVKVDGNWQNVDYRFVEIKVGKTAVFSSHDPSTDTGSCLAEQLTYPEATVNGQYQAEYIGDSSSESSEYHVDITTNKNELIGGEVSLEAYKEWEDDFDDGYNTRPTNGIIVFKVQRKTDDTDFEDYNDNKGDVIKFNVTKKADGWSGRIDHLPKYSEDGKLYEYQAVEEVPANYLQTDHDNNATDTAFVTTEENTLRTVEISGTKTWNTPEEIEAIEKGKVQLALMRKAGSGSAETVTYKQNNGQPEWTKTGDNQFTYKYTKLPEVSKDNEEYTYWVVESPVSGFVNSYTDGNTKLAIQNTATALKLDKIDEDTRKAISGQDLELTVCDSTGNEIAKWTRASGDKGTFTLVDGITEQGAYAHLYTKEDVLYALPLGKYVVKETKTPAHYNTAADKEITVAAGNVVESPLTGTVEDLAKGTSIRFQKIDAETGNELAGAEFTLSDGTESWTLRSDKGTFSQGELRPGTYTLEESKHPAGYPDSIDDNKFKCEFEITNADKDTVITAKMLKERATLISGKWYEASGEVKGAYNKPSHIDIPVTKTWDDADDQDGLRKEVEVKLLADSKDTGESVKLNKDNGWKSEFKDLTEYVDGKRVVYTVEEVSVEYYKTEITGDMDKGFTIKNSHTPFVTEISGHKTWTDADDQDGFRPESITIKLKADGEYVEGKEVTVTADDDWAWSFDKLPKFRDGGKLIDYTFEETAFDGKVLPEEGTEEYYEVSYKVTEEEKADHADGLKKIEVTNTHKPVQIEVPVEKIWNDADDQDGIRPADITVQLLADGTPVEDKILTLNDENEWKGSFTELDKYRDGGTRIVYTIEEITVDEYATAVEGDMDEGFVVTNSHEPYIISIEGNKIWDDADDQDGFRPESITVRLLADGVEIDNKVVTEDDDWAWSFTDLPKRQAGMDINYVITEDAITTPDGKGNYTPSFEYSEVEETTPEGELNRTFRQTVEVTNTHNPCKVCVPVTKCWDDGNNADGIRPKAIEVQLYADGEAVEGKALTLNEKNKWAGIFEDLDEFKDGGQTINYTIEEISVKDYETKLTGDSIRGYVLTNTHKPTDDVRTGDPTSLLSLYEFIGSFAGLCVILLGALRRRREE